jgi:hypothetical protein
MKENTSMRYANTTFNTKISKFLLLVIFFNTFFGLNLILPPEARAQSRPIIITADQPNVWTLEQAHYLLAQMHRRNLDLRAAPLSDLDANALNGNRLDVLRTFLDINASFNQAAGFDNKLAAKNKEFNANRQPQLIRQRDELNKQNLALVQDIARLESQLRRSEGTDKEKLNAEIDEKKAVQAVVKEQITQIDNELKTLNNASGSFISTLPTTSFDPSKLPSGVLDDALKNAIKGLDNSPQLNASLQLENYLQMQYEILAKQLTLLRDEVGPGERLLFLEIPQSIRTTRGKADKKWAQTWFKIAGYICKPYPQLPCGGEEWKGNEENIKSSTKLNLAPKTYQEKSREIFEDNEGKNKENKNKDDKNKARFVSLEPKELEDYKRTGDEDSKKISNREVRVVDLVPRQSSLNVNDVKLRTNASGFGFLASFLFGFGASLNYQRQREQFSQFVQQELYSSGFGKGSNEFGWTFTPMPGTSRLMSGTRTTYAIIVVPKNAESLVLESSGCYFPRSEYQPLNFKNTQQKNNWLEPDDPSEDDDSRMCTKQESVLIYIPGGGNPDEPTFKITEIEYKSVAANERVMVTVRGISFPTQIGVIVGGKSLIQSIGLAQPLIDDDSDVRQRIREDFNANGDGIYGEFERLSDRQITFWFKMPKDYKGGTPPISIVAPGEAKLLNRDKNIDITVNGDPAGGTLDEAPYMFGERLRDRANGLEINGVDVYRNTETEVTVVLRGKKLNLVDRTKVFINGQPIAANSQVKSSELHWLVNQTVSPKDEFIQVTLVAEKDVLQPAKVKNPLFKPTTKPDPTEDPLKLLVKNVSLYDIKPGDETHPFQLTIQLDGIGFVENMVTSFGKYTFESETKAYLTLDDPPPSVKVKLTDEKNNLFTTVTIRRKDFTK